MSSLDQDQTHHQLDYEISLGDYFREKRKSLGIDQHTASNYLRVRVRDISAIEKNEIEKISKNIYAPGFIRSYGKYLKIDTKYIEHKIKEYSFRSNTENKKHILVNIGEHLELTPTRELYVNGSLISLFIFVSFLAISSFINKTKELNNTSTIIEELKLIKKQDGKN